MMLGWGGRSADIHTGQRTNVVRKEQRAGLELVFAQAVLGKDRSAYGVHVRPSSFTTHGVQTLHLLSALGFERSDCKFLPGGAWCRAVREDFDLGAFADALEKGYALLREAGGHLEACGYIVTGGDNSMAKFIFVRPVERLGGDGHTGGQEKPLKQSEDDTFRYVLT